MSISKGLVRLGRRKSAAGLSLESADGWFPVGKQRELTADAAMKISAVNAWDDEAFVNGYITAPAAPGGETTE